MDNDEARERLRKITSRKLPPMNVSNEMRKFDEEIDCQMKFMKKVFWIGLVVKLVILGLLVWGGIVLVQWITSK